MNPLYAVPGVAALFTLALGVQTGDPVVGPPLEIQECGRYIVFNQAGSETVRICGAHDEHEAALGAVENASSGMDDNVECPTSECDSIASWACTPDVVVLGWSAIALFLGDDCWSVTLQSSQIGVGCEICPPV